MVNKDLFTLRIDPQFKELILPLYKKEYKKLERSILSKGCTNPITIWKGTIVDGHNRYEICSRHIVPFAVEEVSFDSRDEAIAWICIKQLKRSSLPDEMRHYLIGKQYEAEKAAYWRDMSLVDNPQRPYRNNKPPTNSKTRMRVSISDRIAQENSVSRSTVEKYALYAKAIDAIRSKRAEIVINILCGQYKVSHNNVIEMSKLSAPDLVKVQRRIEVMQQDSIKYNQMRKILKSSVPKRKSEQKTVDGPSVKDMPQFDPDAEIVGLTLTIPSWIRSIDRVIIKTDLATASDDAKNNLIYASREIVSHIEKLISALEEN